MGRSPVDIGYRHSELYESLALQWVKQTRQYARSVQLFQEGVVGRDGQRRRDLQPSRMTASRPALHLSSVVVPVNESAAGDLASRPVGRCRPGSCAPLTARQTEIAGLIAEGLTNEQIAVRLVLTPGTVGNHVGQILRRLGAGNRTQVAAWLIRQMPYGPPAEADSEW